MSYSYEEKIYLHCIQSKFNTNKFFTYKAEGDCIDGQYESKNAALNAADSYDKTFLYLIPTEGEVTSESTSSSIFEFRGYDNEIISLQNLLGTISSSNKTIVPQLTDFNSDTQITLTTIYNIYQKTYKLNIERPASYTESELSTLIANMNRIFDIKLPRSAGSYIYDKTHGIWNLDSTAV